MAMAKVPMDWGCMDRMPGRPPTPMELAVEEVMTEKTPAIPEPSLGLRRYVADAFFVEGVGLQTVIESFRKFTPGIGALQTKLLWIWRKMMRIVKSFRNLSGLERRMWFGSVLVLVLSFILT